MNSLLSCCIHFSTKHLLAQTRFRDLLFRVESMLKVQILCTLHFSDITWNICLFLYCKFRLKNNSSHVTYGRIYFFSQVLNFTCIAREYHLCSPWNRKRKNVRVWPAFYGTFQRNITLTRFVRSSNICYQWPSDLPTVSDTTVSSVLKSSRVCHIVTSHWRKLKINVFEGF